MKDKPMMMVGPTDIELREIDYQIILAAQSMIPVLQQVAVAIQNATNSFVALRRAAQHRR